ncbi:hypothetical protein [Brenneria alni]|uniref:hypothetical protein n=1 Tax=Brenneria alni TaxID=71656 RepID=UPI0011C41506|nr:hypothetical protein [Brenneria alni]
MGSSGSGSFTDYSNAEKKVTDGGEVSGGDSGLDRCETAFSAGLEDVALYSYYQKYNNVPPINSKVEIVFTKRLTAIDIGTRLELGALPTKYNYLLACMHSGFHYIGIVSHVTNSISPQVVVDIVTK